MPEIVSFINMKGGVGKTTLAVNVAYGLAALHHQKVLVVDADPQFNATQYLMEDEAYLRHVNDPKRATLHDIFVPKRPGPISSVKGVSRTVNRSRISLGACTCEIWTDDRGLGRLDLIPSTLGLMEIETSKRMTETKLKAFLHEKAGSYDYVLIDCPPTISIFTQAAILASNRYLVPIKPDPLSIIGLPLLERALEDYSEDAGVDVEPVGLVFTMVRGPTPPRMQEVMDELRSARGDQVFGAELSQSTDVAEAVEGHLPVFGHKPNSKTARQVKAITNEFVDRTSGD